MITLRAALPGICIEKQLEPSHSLLDLVSQQFEAQQLAYLSPDRCTSREWEWPWERLQSRPGVAYAFADLPEWTVHERYITQLFGHLRKDPPQGYAPLGLHCGSMRCVVCGVGGWVLCVGGGVLRFVCAATSDIPDASVFQCFL